jgi:hypothetical protein
MEKNNVTKQGTLSFLLENLSVTFGTVKSELL